MVACRRGGATGGTGCCARATEAVWTAARVPRRLIDDFQRRLELVRPPAAPATGGAAASSAASAVPPRKHGGGLGTRGGDA